MKDILVTGAEGFIGSNFVRRLLQSPDVYNVTCTTGDINDWFDGKHYDYVVHLAAEAGVRNWQDNPEKYWHSNVAGSQQIFDNYSSARIVYASSSSIYEWWQNPYAMTKKAMEAIAPANSIGLRFHTVYGKNSRPDMFFEQLLRDEITYITDHKRDWTHVEDVIDAILIAMDSDLVGAVDVGTGEPVKVQDVVEYYGKGPYPFKEVTGESQITCADPSIMKEWGWEPKHHILREDVKEYA